MKNKFSINISSTKNYGDYTDSYKFSTDCEYEITNQDKIITYKEPTDSSFGGGVISTIVLHGDGTLRIVRNNDTEKSMIFAPNITYSCKLYTDYGDFCFCIFTKTLICEPTSCGIIIFIEYDLLIADKKLFTAELKIQVEKH